MRYSFLRSFRDELSASSSAPDEPIRSELFSVERLESHAESLAAAQIVLPRRSAGRRLSARVYEDAKVLLEAYRTIAGATRLGRPITPAAEWLLDNFHVVEEQIREIKTDLPPRYYRELPKLAKGHLEGYPRIFGIAWAFVAHTDSRFDFHALVRFVTAYQRVQPLTIGELWAIAITLRITLVENLRRLAQTIVRNREESRKADIAADRLLGANGNEPEPVAKVLRDYEDAPLLGAFAAQLDYRLRDQDEMVAPALAWLTERLAAQATTPDRVVHDELRRQGSLNVTVRNVITSMRMISDINWADFFESVSLVDAQLRADSDFEAMNFATRNLYRRAVERIARGSGRSELEVARHAVALGKQAVQHAPDGKLSDRERDPGYYLIARGVRRLERELGYRPNLAEWPSRLNAAIGCTGYLAIIALATAIFVAIPLYFLQAQLSGWTLFGLAILAIVPASDAAVSLVNRAVTDRVGPAILPGMELAEGIPSYLRTVVVIPVLLTTRAQIQELIEHLEVHYLASADGDLYFALLSDWTDSETETALDDQLLLETAQQGIARLNRRYGPGAAGARFLLLHRKRVWNDSEEKWIGWERKRGKLHELNRLLRGATDTNFLSVGGKAPTVPPGVQYVITLDADTKLPRETTKLLIGKMAHPLNRPRLDLKLGRVVEGHAILQPRVTPSLPIDREGSLFQRVFSSPRGLDPYAFAVSDVYQDLFQEGSYTGKGIYDVDAFEAALDGRIPENSVLSHDLLEGSFARAGLVSDIEVVEEFPSRYDVASARQHRWVRGDWQLLPWIFGYGRDPRGRKRNVLHLIGRWKMFDNLRRSLSAPTTLLALLLGWMLPPRAAEIWTAFILALMVLPSLLPWITGLVPHQRGISKRSHLRGVGADFAIAAIQAGFLITFLAHQAWMMIDAIIRTVFRLFRRKRLLEWVTAAQVSRAVREDGRGISGQMTGSLIFSLTFLALLYFSHRQSEIIAAPFLALWAVSPVMARWASRSPPSVGHLPVDAADMQSLRKAARRTWRFFETFITADNHMLPPDNFQEEPKPVVARRTSPTNMGLYLLAIVTARDFGWIGTIEAVERLEATLAGMKALERFRGHFYNWYATEDLRPLHPKYISTVDSGNLAGHLIVLKHACRHMKVPLGGERRLAGIQDSLELAREAFDTLSGQLPASASQARQLRAALNDMNAAFEKASASDTEFNREIGEFSTFAQGATAMAQSLAEQMGLPGAQEILIWLKAVCAAIDSHRRDLECFSANRRPSHDLRGESVPALAVKPAQAFGSGPRALVGDGSDGAVRTLTRAAPALNEGSAIAAPPPDNVLTLVQPETKLAQRIEAIADLAQSLFASMEFGFLYEPERQLFSIGYRVDDAALDPNCYDLLASEARLASFIAIAREEVPSKHWFRLGRTLTPIEHGSALISWSGSMFEYLMPTLVMRAPAGSILDRTNRLVVRRQIAYGRELGVPWGVSESLFYARDMEGTYQYSGFGVPDLGYKRGLGENIVIAPYATALAAMVDPKEAAENFQRLTEAGGRGAYGWYEALDFTPTRVREGEKVGIARAYMAHHQAMSIVAIGDALLEGMMREYFHADPIVQATELLLQERMPRDVAVARPPAQKVRSVAKIEHFAPETRRRFNSPHSRIPQTHIMSNGSYAVMVTGAGSGFSRWRNLDVTRWREDVTCDNWGSYIFLRDARSGEMWSATYQPGCTDPDSYDVAFSEGRAEFTRQDGPLKTVLEIVVSPEHDAEVRRVTITNHGSRVREIELTSYAELVLAPSAEDAAHPAFSKLFIETEFVPGTGALLATRRRKSPEQAEVWAAHFVVIEGESNGAIQFETDRARFLGRGHAIRSPSCVIGGWPLSNTAGCVLDPIFSLRCRVRIPRGETVRASFWTAIAGAREEVLDIADKYRDPTIFDRVNTLAWTEAQGQFHHLGIGPEEANLFQRLANRVIYSDPTVRPSSEALKRGGRKRSVLWAHGISGDLPIVLLKVDRTEDLDIVRQLLRAYEYWRLKRLAVDLVILNERSSSYLQDLQGGIDHLVRPIQARPKSDDLRGSVFVLRADLIPQEAATLLHTIARAALSSRRGTLGEQIDRIEDAKRPVVVHPPNPPSATAGPEMPRTRPLLEFFNGLGGFASEGREYVTILERGQLTPAPWINVISNETFGFQISTDGTGFTWSLNSQQNRLTEWSNDPVSDPAGEAIYIRDQDSGELWSPTALPIRDEDASYVATHGQGYSRFEVDSHGFAVELLQYVPCQDAVKISRLKIANRSRHARNISVTGYVEWVLGQSRPMSAPYIVTEIDSETGAMFARNPLSDEFGTRIAFLDMDGRQNSWTGDRSEFLGRNGTLKRPIALLRGTPLSNWTGAGLDPCSALQTTLRLKAGAEIELVFLLGEAAATAEAQALVTKYRTADLNAIFGEVADFWDQTLSKIQVQTPDRAMDVIANRWLLYQTLACRVWARSAFYQSSGAFGFRDQLQDVTALAATKPDITRRHLLHAASRQFPEGDVQHWWLPETGKGVRTRVSDDRIWLPYVTTHYIQTTGDVCVLDEKVPFIEGPVLRDGEYDAFFQPLISEERASLFEHCARALDGALSVGAHGLPLMGTGDWNDGMNRVGADGKGESVWLGWFLYRTLIDFADLAQSRDPTRAARWQDHAAQLKLALEQAWDGDWYRRAYFGDGTPLGSVANTECRIDSIAQSWAIISGAGERTRNTRAMAAVEKYLVRRDEGLVLLFTPPFDKAVPDPGYIKGYPPGVRENGGQYTHAAVWAALAFAAMGNGDKAHELLTLLNPIQHAGNSSALHRYKVEPYAVCADVYGVPPHVGRGGWTWYTGSAGWMYRAIIEGLLGLKLQGATLVIDPCIPRSWPGFNAKFQHGRTVYDIAVENTKRAGRGVASAELDGKAVEGFGARIPLNDDGATHSVRVVLG